MYESPEQARNTKTKGAYVVWTVEMDRVLTETFLDQVQKGNKSKQVNVQARLKTWTKNYNIVTELRQQSGFGWDDNRKMIDMENNIWENYLKSHPEAKGYRYKALTNYDDLAIIVGNAHAKGDGANTEGELEKSGEEGGGGNDDGLEDITEDDDGLDNNFSQQKKGRPTTPVVAKQSTRRKIRTGDVVASAVTMMADMLKSMIPDIDRSLTLKAVDMLAADKTKEHVFHGLPIEFKKEWLMMQFNHLN
ncbi:hypothetical protein AQUCO_02200035v1 [Aquilegia coerulea]|uniref:Myb/SANT-like domain-containing protein n=1 Tax=Aquilegia coerulea TaxID=218851 RepID=A0A2G5DCU6_AQUCA|nr:hypothetical protein AQUCO_02200035v1 [Aquilegia coerulea]